jgi:hypothetical protein
LAALAMGKVACQAALAEEIAGAYMATTASLPLRETTVSFLSFLDIENGVGWVGVGENRLIPLVLGQT